MENEAVLVEDENISISEEKVVIKTKGEGRENYLILKTNHESLVRACEKMVEQNQKLRDRVIYLERLLENAQRAVDINKQIMIDSLTKHNEDNQKAAAEVQALKFKRTAK